ncbi:hypothetical protein PZA11_007893 [Diplocarpon coronariae]
MDNAVNAVNSLFAKGSSAPNAPASDKTAASPPSPSARDVDTTVDSEINPAVEHTHVKKQHETREQTHVERERHQDHYHTTIQPLQDAEVRPEKHDHTQETQSRRINRDDGAAAAQAQADRAGFQSTSEEKQFESRSKEATQVGEHVHHHLHETIQPVIEKEVIEPSVTHHRVDVKERIQEPSQNHGVTTNSTLSVGEFEKKLAGAAS